MLKSQLYGCYHRGTETQLVGFQAAVWVFCAPLGDPLACRAPNKHHFCILCRVSHGVCWDMIRMRCAGNELMLSCPWMQNYWSAFPANVGCLQRAQNWLYHLWLKTNICFLFGWFLSIVFHHTAVIFKEHRCKELCLGFHWAQQLTAGLPLFPTLILMLNYHNFI